MPSYTSRVTPGQSSQVAPAKLNAKLHQPSYSVSVQPSQRCCERHYDSRVALTGRVVIDLPDPFRVVAVVKVVELHDVLCVVEGVEVVDLPDVLCVVAGAKVCCVLFQVSRWWTYLTYCVLLQVPGCVV